MKTIVLTFTLFLATFIVFGFKQNTSQTKTDEGIQFFTGTWQQAIDKAKKENKYIFLDAYASWCGPCKMMKKKTFADKAVGVFYNKNFICVALDMEKGEGTSLSNKYSVEAYPTLIFLSPNGKLIEKAVGFRNAKEFLGMGVSITKNK